MENKTKKCSSKDHSEIDSSTYCVICKVYMCNKCENFHSKLCQTHKIYNINQNNEEIFTGLCKEENHSIKLKYFCKNHNKLCCAACLSKIKDMEYGQHKDCDVCIIEEIKFEKKDKLKDNIKYLNDLSNTIHKSIENLNKLYEKMKEDKEKLKLEIQKIFTKLRNELNEREDKLLLDVDEKFNELYFKEEFLKETEKLPNRIKTSLEQGNIKEEDWNNEDKLFIVISKCTNIEDNIKQVKQINEKINKCSEINNEIKFKPNINEIDDNIKFIKEFGNIYCNQKNLNIELNIK